MEPIKITPRKLTPEELAGPPMGPSAALVAAASAPPRGAAAAGQGPQSVHLDVQQALIDVRQAAVMMPPATSVAAAAGPTSALKEATAGPAGNPFANLIAGPMAPRAVGGGPAAATGPGGAAAPPGEAAGGEAAAAAAGPAGLAAMAAKKTIEVFDQTLRGGIKEVSNFSAAVASFDPQQFRAVATGWLDSMDSAIKGVSPLAGMVSGAVKETVKGTFAVNDALNATARDLSRWSGALASQQAAFRVRDIQQEINRAQTFEPFILSQQAADDRWRQQVQQMYDTLFPVVSTGITQILTTISNFADLVKSGFDNLLRVTEETLMNANIGGINNGLIDTVRNLRTLIRMGERMQQQRQQRNPFVDEFLQQRLPTQAIQEERARTDQLERARLNRAQLFPNL